MASSGASATEVAAADVERILATPEAHTLVAQPVVDLARGTVVGYELLSRFDIGRRVTPDKVFIAAARYGLGGALEAHVLSRALAIAASRPANCFLAINVEPTHLVAAELDPALGDHRLDGIVFELTEHHVFDDLGALRRAIDALRERGALIALDDAGAGYSGLRRILELRPEIIKLDRDLVSGLHDDGGKRALVGSVGELASRLDAWVLAEGIETGEEAAAIAALGVPLVQGYYFAAPAPLWWTIEKDAGDTRARYRAAKKVVGSGGLPPDLTALLTSCHVLAPGGDWPSSRVAISLDENAAPLALRVIGPNGPRLRSRHELMRVKRESSPHEVARRAVTRDERYRWDPLVCVDDRGRFLGVVTLEGIIEALAETREPEPKAADVIELVAQVPAGK